MSWFQDIKAFQRHVEEQHAELVRDRAIRVYQGVLFRSPVLSGRFRGSWNISWNAPDLDTLPEVSGSFSQLPQSLQPSGVPFPVAFVANNIVYGPRLEEGWSSQAPSGMVAVTVAEVEALQ